MFSDEKIILSDKGHIDLSRVKSEEFFSPKNRELILSRLDKGSQGKGIRGIAHDCLRHAYEEGFDIHEALLKYEISKVPAAAAKKNNIKEKGG